MRITPEGKNGSGGRPLRRTDRPSDWKTARVERSGTAGGLASRIGISMIEGYRRYLSPLLPPLCRFYPTCSEYALEAVTRYGLARGSAKALARLAKCHPLHPGGFDPVN